MSACSHSQGVGVLLSLLPASLFEHVSMGQARNPTDTVEHTLCVSRARTPILAVQPPHVCHRQRDWAVSIGSHMQQDMGISSAPPHLGAAFPLFDAVHVRKPRSKKLAMIPLTHSGHLCVSQSVFSAPQGATCKISGKQYHKQTHLPRKYFEVHSTASERCNSRKKRSETKRVKASEIIFLETYFRVG